MPKLAQAHGRIATDVATRLWDESMAATWHGSDVWFHGDVSDANLLVRMKDDSDNVEPSGNSVAARNLHTWTKFKGLDPENVSASDFVLRVSLALRDGSCPEPLR